VLDDLLPYYNHELRFMRELAKEFAAANPKIAGRLRISQEAIEDPHVGRLVEAFAFLNARMRLKLEDDFPELSESLLGMLHPHYLAPFPSMSVVQITPQDLIQSKLTLPAGAGLQTEPVNGEALQYRTGYPVELWPIELTSATLSGLPLVAPANPQAGAAQSVLRLSLRCTQKDQTFSGLGLDRLRFYLHGESRSAQILYELILGGTVSVALADSAVDEAPVILDRSNVRAVGFDPSEILLPMPPAAEPGYALLSEYFNFPEKFLFFDIVGLDAKTLLGAGHTMEIFIYSDRHDTNLERVVSKQDFRLFCTPIVNLFRMRADPLRLNPGHYEHRVIPDARRETAMEVYSIDNLVVTDRHGEEMVYRPFYSVGRRQYGKEPVTRFWHAVRRASPYEGGGDDLYITMTDSDGRAVSDADHVASIEITATNRNLPSRLPFGGGRPSLTLSSSTGVARLECLIAPTRPVRAKRGHGTVWRLVSHLALNNLSVAGKAPALDVVKEMLSLYEQVSTPANRAVVERLSGVETTPGVARAPGAGRIAFTSGSDITLTFDDQRLSGSGAFMLGAVLEALFASLAAVNAFSRTRLRLKGDKGIWRQWPARTGTRQLI
jgi:type VI secretion system protein ImpG